MTHNDVQECYQIVRSLFKQGKIDELAYFKMTVGFAADYAMLGLIDDAVGLLSSVPSDYYLKNQEEHLREDPSYREKVLFLTRQLVECKKVNVNEDVEDEMMYRVMLGVGKIGKA